MRQAEFGSTPFAPVVIKIPMHAVENYGALAKLHPVGLIGGVRDIAEAVLYVKSSDFVTGAILHVDGGSSVGH